MWISLRGPLISLVVPLYEQMRVVLALTAFQDPSPLRSGMTCSVLLS